jgi:hypothetical protein
MPRKKKPYTYFRREDLGITYVYANEDVWDEEQQKYVRKRHMIGKLDEDTNEIIPTSGRGGYRGRKASPETVAPMESPSESAAESEAESVSAADTPKAVVNPGAEAARYEEEKSAFTEYKRAANAKIRELNLKIDQLTVTLEDVRRRYAELCRKVGEAAELIRESESEQ